MSDVRIRVVEDDEELARTGADLIGEAVAAVPSASIVVATGRTPMGLYAELATRRRAGALDTDGITVYQLDEYLGIEPGDRRSLFGWMQRSFLDPLAIGDDRVVRLPTEGDLDAACASYDRALRSRGRLDVAILGLGPNGHLGFNEPPSEADAGTRVVDLSPQTIEANAHYWGDVRDVPTRAITMGLAPLLSAHAIVLLVSGEAKREILHLALEGPMGPSVPASFLREAAAEVTVIADRAAWGPATALASPAGVRQGDET